MEYQDAFAEILAENLTARHPPYLRRQLDYRVLPQKAVVLKGVRRSGKSTLLRQIGDDEISLGRTCISINFIDERLAGLTAQSLGSLFDAIYRVYPDIHREQPLTLLLDELQVVDGWEAFVERQLRIPDRRVFITGSSAKLLSSEIASAMRGRSLSYEVFPFDFSDYLAILGRKPANLSLGAEAKAEIKAQFQLFMMQGGFPETIGLDQRTRVQILQEYINVLLLRDVIERHDAASPTLVKRFLLQLFSRFASSCTINRCVEQLKAQGFGVAKAHVTEMLEWFLDAYSVFSISLFTESVHKQNTNPKKIYVIDNGMANALTVGRAQNEGRLLENLVFLALRRRSADIHYVKTRGGYEVDFYTPVDGLVQVTWSLADEKTRDREIRALDQAMEEMKINTGMIITADTNETIQADHGTIRCLPAWEWLLKDATLKES